jgi:FtsP/CotA-like multicopper oxidase with cupredoxin domain
MLPMGDCARNYDGPIPAAVHLHGGEVPASLDGGPDSWFTSFGGYKGHAYYSAPGAADNEVIYTYPNSQESAPIWFHDHTLGATRLNVYAGLAGAYLVTDPANDPSNLPELVPLVIQDRMFDTNGELFYPAGVPYVPNPDHPYWIPEFVGDTIVVNGKAWPYLNVEPKRYRFIIINGSNARTYEMFLTNPATKINGPAIYQIGTDGGFLDSPVKIDPNVAAFNKLVMMPGERAEVIIDFRAYAGQTLIIKNTAKTPYPAGATPNGNTLGKIMQLRVAACPAGGCVADNSYDPATGGAVRTKPMVRLVNVATGALQAGVTPNVKRQLTLNEVMGMPMTVGGITYPGGPLEILLNNTKWMASTTETPNEGDTEVWEIVNLTADAHPIHLHLTQFQLLNRQTFDTKKYTSAYNLAFATKLFQPGFGPPSDYNTLNADGAVGGNPAVTPFLKSAAKAPNPNEAGWKDTVLALPGQVTRIAVRFAPTDAPTTTVAGDLYFPFDPSAGGHGYVWHCHIVDHEDNEMMRPTFVNANSTAVRSFVFGVDY